MANSAAPTHWYSIPPPVRSLFDKFPLLTYPENALPTPRRNRDNVLYIFGDGPLSYNPGCLKWQAYLRFSGVEFRTLASNNHASPSGALPFLMPAVVENKKSPAPIPSGKLQRWAMDSGKTTVEESPDPRYEAFLSLVDHRIRRAWLYSIYLSANSTSIAEPLYILPTSRNPFVRLAIASELSRAAEKELLKFSAVIDADFLHAQAGEAFEALETLLGDNEWFFGNDGPGLFDASVFAYTHLLLDDSLGDGWVDTRLRDAVAQKGRRLVAHRDRIVEKFF